MFGFFYKGKIGYVDFMYIYKNDRWFFIQYQHYLLPIVKQLPVTPSNPNLKKPPTLAPPTQPKPKPKLQQQPPKPS